MEVKDAIKESVIFKGLQDDELDEIFQIMREKRFLKGETIMKEGDQGDTMYIVLEGEVGVSKSLTMKFGDDDYRETEKILTRFKPEDHVVFGEMALIAQDRRSATINASSDCVFLEINRNDFVRLIEKRPNLGIKILLNISQLLVKRLRQSSQDVMRLTTALSIALSK
ncbi:MAG: cyclic nucleotide-binding domain-containing protein [Deltaproteobacteria bacterium]|nr:cyclic nucleotide-binding domain-containing protein [Deltaproteobacteria bacterium]